MCNQRIKFGAFLSKIGTDFAFVATGHYAQTSNEQGVARLLKAPDPIKDQTYFLSHVSQQQLSRALFPIGHMAKHEVRAYAHAIDIPNKSRKDSQGICFLGKLKFSEFLRFHLGERVGQLVEMETGTVMGTHAGFWYYTIGQRQGIGLAGGPWYVVSKDSAANIVYISRAYYQEDKIRDHFEIVNCHWITGTAPQKTALEVKLRHGSHSYPCTIDFINDNHARIQLAERDQGIAPGQFAVLYDGNECLGGGVINNSSLL